MAEIYSLPSGVQVYDYNGATYNAKTGQVVSGNPQPPQGVSMISTAKGSDIVDQKTQTAQRLMGSIVPTNPNPTPTPTPTATPTEQQTNVTLLNPTSGQKLTFNDASLNKETIQGYLNTGWGVSQASGTIPDWLQPQAGGGFAAVSQNPELDAAKQAVADATSKLANLDVSQDPTLQRMLANITAQWDQRISDMQAVNASRKGAVTTQGIRLGSRYTGGTYQGIVSEEERQGIDRIASLQSQKDQALLDAQQAYYNQEWTKYSKAVDLAEQHYSDIIGEIKTLNQAQTTQTQKLAEQQRLSTIGQAVSTALGSLGDAATTKDIFDAISGAKSLQGLNASTDEIKQALTDLTGVKDVTQLGTDLRDFNYIKNNVGLPMDVAGLPVEEQFLAWQKKMKDAQTSDSSTRYQVITDPVTGDQSIFDRQAGSFIGAPPSGSGNMKPADAVTLNAAKTLAIKDPSGGKLLVREVSNKLAQGDSEGALKLVTDSAINTMTGTQQENYQMYENSIAASSQALQFANTSGVSVGPYQALYQSHAPMALIDRDPKYAYLKQLIGLADAQVRRGFFGTAVTATEGGTANAFLFDPTDSMEVIKQKLKGNMAFFSFVNDLAISQSTGLPRPNLNEYLAKFGVDPQNMSGLDQDLLNSSYSTQSATSANNPAGI